MKLIAWYQGNSWRLHHHHLHHQHATSYIKINKYVISSLCNCSFLWHSLKEEEEERFLNKINIPRRRLLLWKVSSNYASWIIKSCCIKERERVKVFFSFMHNAFNTIVYDVIATTFTPEPSLYWLEFVQQQQQLNEKFFHWAKERPWFL